MVQHISYGSSILQMQQIVQLLREVLGLHIF